MTKSGQRLIAAAKEARGIARGEIEPARMYIPADIDVRQTDRIEELEDALEKAVEALDEAVYLLAPTESDMEKEEGVYRIVTTLEELKPQESHHNTTQEKRL